MKKERIDILALKRLKVYDENGLFHYFSDFLELPLLTIIFVRHFGCIACRAHVDQIWNLDKLQKNKKNKIIFIGSGSSHVIKTFKEEMNVQDADIYTDPSLEVFDACGMNRGMKNLVNLKSIKGVRKLQKKGYSQGSFKDSGANRQMGGVLVLKRVGEVLYSFASEFVGDLAESEDIEKTANSVG